MITIKNNVFHIATNNTSYVFFINESGLAEHLYYGRRLRAPESNLEPLREKHSCKKGNETALNENDDTLQLYNLPLEFSTEDKGDYRTPFVSVSYGDRGLRTLDLRFKSYHTFTGIERFDSPLVQALGNEDNTCGVILDFIDERAEIKLSLVYTTFSDSDVITRRAIIENIGANEMILRSAFSAQLDLPTSDYLLSTFEGAWARERHENRRPISGKIVNESRRGASSAEHGPGIILQKENSQDTFAFNLVYSGAHQSVVEVNSYKKTHVLIGINPDMFTAHLQPKMSFETPEAVLLYSKDGREGIRKQMHNFVRLHIQRGLWKERMRPVIFNSWEGCHFSFNEQKLSSLVKNAASLGFEMFVLDDGWFAVRNDDTTSLGDWSVNTLKIPQGLGGLSKEVHRSGMLFGLWIEPEMISLKSHLYMKHPEWVLGDPRRKEHAVGRNQYILDITREDVQEYLITTIKNLIQNASIDYIKWDMNRHLSDMYSSLQDQGEYMHRYILALYRLQKSIMIACPNVLLENCASGGTRFDLGMMAYGGQLWTSDASDPFERIPIMEGSLALYPLSVTATSVALEENFATKRKTSLATRFEVAAFGCLSYSLDLDKLTKAEKQEVRSQIEFYKQYRQVLQFGSFRVEQSGNVTIWTASDADKKNIIALFALKYTEANPEDDILRITDADENSLYRVMKRDEADGNIWDYGSDLMRYRGEAEVYEVSGDVLKWAGLRLSSRFSGGGESENMRIMSVFSTRMYIIKKIG